MKFREREKREIVCRRESPEGTERGRKKEFKTSLESKRNHLTFSFHPAVRKHFWDAKNRTGKSDGKER